MNQKSEKVNGVYFIISIIDSLMSAGEFNAVDIILKDSMRDSISTAFLVALATVTLQAKSKLNNRSEFMQYFRKYTENDQNQEQLLMGLE